MSRLKTMALGLAAGLVLFTAVGCEKKEEGPAEKAGKEIDKAGDHIGKAMQDMGEKMQDKSKGD